MLKKALILAHKDLQLEFQNHLMLGSLLFLSWLFIFVASFGARYMKDDTTGFGVIALWLIFVFIATIVLNKSLALEKEYGCWDGLRLCPVAPRSIFTGKLIYNVALLFLVEILSIPFFLFLFNAPMRSLAAFLPIALGIFGFTGVGLLFALAALNTESRDVVLPVVILPFLIPLFFTGLHASLMLARGETGKALPFLGLMAGYDIIFVAAAMFLFNPEGREFE